VIDDLKTWGETLLTKEHLNKFCASHKTNYNSFIMVTKVRRGKMICTVYRLQCWVYLFCSIERRHAEVQIQCFSLPEELPFNSADCTEQADA